MTHSEQHPEPLEKMPPAFIISNFYETDSLPKLPTKAEDFIGPSILAQLKWLDSLPDNQKLFSEKYDKDFSSGQDSYRGPKYLESLINKPPAGQLTPAPYVIKSLLGQMKSILDELDEQPSYSQADESPYGQLSNPAKELLTPSAGRLSDTLAAILPGINFADIAVPKRKNKPVTEQVEDLDQYRLVPVRRVTQVTTDAILKHLIEIPAGIRTSYRTEGGSPFLDTKFAVGLVYGDWLVAIGAASQTSTGDMLVRQLQDVSGVRLSTNPERSDETGLRNGFWWRDTLVKAWEELARAVGINGVAIQSNANNFYPEVKNADGRGYDEVARRMHYTEQDRNGNWRKPE